MKVTLSNHQIIQFSETLSNFANLQDAEKLPFKVIHAITRNAEKLTTEANHIRKAITANVQYVEYEKQRNDLIKLYKESIQKTDDSRSTEEKNADFNNEMSVLNDQFKDQIQEVSDFVQQTNEIELYELHIDVVNNCKLNPRLGQIVSYFVTENLIQKPELQILK